MAREGVLDGKLEEAGWSQIKHVCSECFLLVSGLFARDSSTWIHLIST